MPKSAKNRKILFLTGILLSVATILLLVIFHLVIHRNIMVKAYETVSNLAHVQLAIRQYVKNTLRPEIYRLEQNGLLQPGYFSPELMSRSFVSREIISIFLNMQQQGLDATVFRYASKSPLNPQNTATAHEAQLLTLFEQNVTSEFREEVVQDGKKVLFYAVPLDRFSASCMGCHSDPAIAPRSLVERYGTSHGFFKHEGDLSGLMSIAIPLAYFNAQCTETTMMVSIVVMLGCGILFFLIRYIIVKKDAHDMLLEQHNQELDRLSMTDPLTGLDNRLSFNQKTDSLFAQKAGKHIPAALLVIDIDHFKSVNDAYGHSIGDEVLQNFGGFLNKMSRKSDFIARIGGEEFVVVTDMDKADLHNYAQRLLEEMPNVVYPADLHITASIGIAILRADDDKKSFFSRADKAMYRSKETGRYCYTMAD